MFIQCDSVFLQVISFGKCAHTKQNMFIMLQLILFSVYILCTRTRHHLLLCFVSVLFVIKKIVLKS